ncbi:hypothetical protein B0T16DRAFT_297605, partial [Cercophora newfieldiana]
KRVIKGPLKKPQPRSTAASYTQSLAMKNEISTGNKNPPAVREISLTTVPQPFVNPSDAFSGLS